MKQSTTCFLLQILPAILLLCFSGVAQQRQDTPAKQELALEVNSGWEIPAVNGGGGEVSNIRHLESWKPSNGEVPVVSIIFKIGREADIVIAHLSVRLENDKEVMVGTYRLNEDETIKTEALTTFGLEPLVLRVVKARPPFKDPLSPIMPKLENKTKAIEVISFYQAAPPREDSFQLSLRNISNKNIIALGVSPARNPYCCE